MRTFARPVALAGALFLLQACVSAPGAERPDGHHGPAEGGRDLITAAEIVESGSRTAWEALRRAGRFSMRESARGEPASMKFRGSRSLVLDDTPLVVLDGVAIRDIRILETIRAETIEWMEILNAADGASLHGPMAGGGAIVIQTKGGP